MLRNLLLLPILAATLSPACFAQAQLAGEWQGTLDAGGSLRHILWHATAGPDGVLTSTFDNTDEGVYGIKVKSVTLNGSDVTIAIDDVVQANGQSEPLSGSFVGTVNKDASEITGTWTQTQPNPQQAPLTLKRAATPAAAGTPAHPPSANIAGEWQGALDAGAKQFRIAWHVLAAPDGSFTSTIDNLDQGIYGIKVKSTTVNESNLTLEVDDVIQVNGQEAHVRGTLVGKVNNDASEVIATWTQTEPEEDPPLPLNLKRQPAAAAR